MRQNDNEQTNDHRILPKIEALVAETFGLWDEGWVGFSSPRYCLNHTHRVRNLSREIGRREGADLRVLEYATLLHDITKRYDGVILMDDQGNRVVDERGFWQNEPLLPARENRVTELYRTNDLSGTLHNLSGAIIAEKVLEEHGLPQAFRSAVASVVRGHLRSEHADWDGGGLEGDILHEADTMDSNLGLVAFFRNIQIHTHRAVERTGKLELREYVQYIPNWLDMKEDFLIKTHTATGQKLGETRQQRNREIYEQLARETEDFDVNVRFGLLGVVQYLMSCHEDPDMPAQMAHLRETWIPERQNTPDGPVAREALDRTLNFVALLESEVAGEL